MRYRFRGLIRSNGKPVEGHVEAPNTDEALNALSDNGIVTESLREEPKALDLSSEPHKDPDLVKAIESALDISSTQVPFDALADKFKGKSVWVVDRDKIRRMVAQVVDSALAQAMEGSNNSEETRARVAEAIDGLFRDNRNLTSKVSNSSNQLDQQILRLGSFINKAESVLAAISIAIRGGFVGGGDGPRRHMMVSPATEERNEVLVEIFKSNLELRGIAVDEAPAGDAGESPGEQVAVGEAISKPNSLPPREPPTPAPVPPAGPT